MRLQLAVALILGFVSVLPTGERSPRALLVETPIPGFPSAPTHMVVNADGSRVVTPVGIIDSASGQVITPYRFDHVYGGTFSPDATRVAFAAAHQRKLVAVVDGTPSKPYDEIRGFLFSRDSKHLVLVAKVNKRFVINLDGRDSRPYAGIEDVFFDGTGNHLAFVAWQDGKQTAVVDGIEGPFHDEIASLNFDPETGAIRYVATNRRTNEAFLYRGDKVVRKLPFPDKGIKRASPNAEHYAYSVRTGEKERVIIDGVEQPLYDEINEIKYSPNSLRVAYVARRGDRRFVVLDGKEQKHYDGISGMLSGKETEGLNAFIFSPDSSRLAYAARIGKERLVVVDGIEGRPYHLVYSFLFSPNSMRLAYMAEKPAPGGVFLHGTTTHVVVDGIEDREYTEVFGMVFSPDSSRFSYGACFWKGNTICQGRPHEIVLEDSGHSLKQTWQASGAQSSIPVNTYGTRVVFDSSHRARFFWAEATKKPDSFRMVSVREAGR